MTWLLVRIKPLGSMMKPEPCTVFGWMASWLAGTLAAFIAAEAGVSVTNEVMLTTVGSRPRIRSAWLGGMICICCAAAGADARGDRPAASVSPDSMPGRMPGRMIDNKRWRMVAGSVGIAT